MIFYRTYIFIYHQQRIKYFNIFVFNLYSIIQDDINTYYVFYFIYFFIIHYLVASLLYSSVTKYVITSFLFQVSDTYVFRSVEKISNTKTGKVKRIIFTRFNCKTVNELESCYAVIFINLFSVIIKSVSLLRNKRGDGIIIPCIIKLFVK